MITEPIWIAMISLAGLVLSSPVILALLNRKPTKKTDSKLDEILSRLDATDKKVEDTRNSLEDYKKEQAVQDFTQKNWKILDQGKANSFVIQEWLLLKSQLEKLIPEATWPESLKRETRDALIIIRKENIANG